MADTFGGGARASSTGDAAVEFGQGYESGDGFAANQALVPIWRCVDGCAVALLDVQSGSLKSGVPTRRSASSADRDGNRSGDEGGASRFFYCAKASRSERNRGVPEGNKHPTVKPVKLMEYLVRLVTPPGGTVLDPYVGSGTTMIAANLLGFDGIGIDLDEEGFHLDVARRRIEAWEAQPDGPEQDELPFG